MDFELLSEHFDGPSAVIERGWAVLDDRYAVRLDV